MASPPDPWWQANAAAGHDEQALAAYRRTLEIETTFTRAYVALAQVLASRGQRDEALRYLRRGAKVAVKPDEVRDALKRIEAEPEAQLP